MKKFVLALMLISTNAMAKIEVPIVWGFGLSAGWVQQIREIISHANQSQSKYYFVFQNRPGAGGAIAAGQVAKSNELSILASSSTFFVTAYQSAEKSYNPGQFSMIGVQCVGQPIFLLSKRYQSLNEMLKNKDLSVGVLPGIMDLVLHEIRSQLNSNKFQPIYHITSEQVTVNLLGKHIDAGIIPLANVVGHELNVLGISGAKPLNGWRTFESQNIKNITDITINFYFFSRVDIAEDIKKELSQILNAATLSHRSVSLCEANYGAVRGMIYPETNTVMTQQINFWKQKVNEYQKTNTTIK